LLGHETFLDTVTGGFAVPSLTSGQS
jgi:hypothetical protein